MKKVISTHIDTIHYDAPTKTLYVAFKGGGTYKYQNVPQDTYNNLDSSQSKGKYFIDNIKNKFYNSKV